MIRRAVKDSSLYILASFLTRGINILLLPLYTHILAPKDYGNIDMMYTFASIINLVIALEISQALGRFLPDNPEKEARVHYISTGFWFTFLVFVLFGLAMFAGAPYVSHQILSEDVPYMTFMLGIVSICAQGPYLYLVNVLKWTLRTKANAITNVITSLVIVLSTIFTLLYLELGIAGVFLANFAGNITGMIIAWVILKSEVKAGFSRKHLKEMIMFSSPLVLSSAAIFITLYTDRILLKYFKGSDAVGLYGIGFRFASIVHLVLYGMQNAVTPLIINQYKDETTPYKIEKLFRYFLILMTVPALGYILFAKDVLILFTTPQYYIAWTTIPLIALSIIFSSIYVFTPGLTIAKQTKKIALTSILSAAVNVSAALVLIPRYGITGAATAAVLSAIVMFALYLFFNQRYYPLPLNTKRYFAFTLALTLFGSLASYAASRQAFELHTWGIILKCLGLTVAVAIAGTILITKSEFLDLKKMIGLKN